LLFSQYQLIADFPIDSFFQVIELNQDPKIVGEAYGEILWHYIETENDSLLALAEEARMAALKDNYPFGEIIALEYQGLYLELVKNEYDKAAEIYLKAIRICEAKNVDYLESLYHALAALFHATDNYKQALIYYGKTLEIVKPKQDTGLIASSLVNLGTVHSSMGDNNRARELLYESLKFSKNHLESRNTAYSSIGNTFFRDGDYEQANVCQLNELEPYLEKGLTLANSSQSLRTRSFFYRSAAKAYGRLGNQDLALKYLDKFVDTFERLKDNQRDAIVFDLEAKYDSSKKEAELANSERKNKQLFFGMGLLLLGLGLISYLLLENRKKNRLLDQQNKQLQEANENASMLLREIHHRVKNNLQIVSSIGLILNELITNSLKHGFKDRSSGTVLFRVVELDQVYEMVVEDNGNGGDGKKEVNGLGSKLISSFTKKLGAKLVIQKGDGYRTKIILPKRTPSESN